SMYFVQLRIAGLTSVPDYPGNSVKYSRCTKCGTASTLGALLIVRKRLTDNSQGTVVNKFGEDDV
ncbi:hypothetical protein AVEN_199139-1, partial [Araneus ventricosus]